MRALRYLLIILILFAIKLSGQDTAMINNYDQFLIDYVKETELEREIVNDSIEYELRLWINDCFFADELIQITKDLHNNWDYRLGYFKYIDNVRIFEFQDSLKKSVDWKQFEIKLDSFVVAKIPNQNEIELKFTKDGKTHEINNEGFFATAIDGVAFSIEIYDNKTHKTVYYNNPHSYLDDLAKIGLPTKEHEAFIKFIDYVIENFDLQKLQMIQIKEIIEEKDNMKRNNKSKY